MPNSGLPPHSEERISIVFQSTQSNTNERFWTWRANKSWIASNLKKLKRQHHMSAGDRCCRWPAVTATSSYPFLPCTPLHSRSAGSNATILTRGTSMVTPAARTLKFLHLNLPEDRSKLSSQCMRRSWGLWERRGFKRMWHGHVTVPRNEGSLTSPVTLAESASAEDKSNSHAQLQLTAATWEFRPTAMTTSGSFGKKLEIWIYMCNLLIHHLLKHCAR